MIWANSAWSYSYDALWHTPLALTIGSFTISQTLHILINDGLMAIFFFLVGLEIKREIFGGELSSPKKAVLPISAAVGGMLVPALIYIFFNQGLMHRMVGIPWRPILPFLWEYYPFLENVYLSQLRFLTALAIVDDLGAV